MLRLRAKTRVARLSNYGIMPEADEELLDRESALMDHLL
jgi:hypothetical protein